MGYTNMYKTKKGAMRAYAKLKKDYPGAMKGWRVTYKHTPHGWVYITRKI